MSFRIYYRILYIKLKFHVFVCPTHRGAERRKLYPKRGEHFERVNMRKTHYGQSDNESGTEKLGVILEGLNGETILRKRRTGGARKYDVLMGDFVLTE